MPLSNLRQRPLLSRSSTMTDRAGAGTLAGVGAALKSTGRKTAPRSGDHSPFFVSARLLPQRLVLDAGDDVGFGDEVFEEAAPLFDGHACGYEHIA